MQIALESPPKLNSSRVSRFSKIIKMLWANFVIYTGICTAVSRKEYQRQIPGEKGQGMVNKPEWRQDAQ